MSEILTLTDHYGRRYSAGSLVAFNKSGEVRQGRVVKIVAKTTNERYEQYRHWIYVQETGSYGIGKPSKIGNSNSVIALD